MPRDRIVGLPASARLSLSPAITEGRMEGMYRLKGNLYMSPEIRYKMLARTVPISASSYQLKKTTGLGKPRQRYLSGSLFG